MSTAALTWAWGQAKAIDNPRVLLTLLALADFADAEDEAWPKRETLAAMVGVDSKGSITRNVAELERLGLISRTPRTRKNGSRTSNVYKLAVATPPTQTGVPTQQRSSTPTQQRGIPPTQQPSSPEPPVDPSDRTTTGSVDPAFDPAVVKVWDHYCAVFKPERAKLGPSRSRGIQRALQEVESADDLCTAIDGLFAYRKQRPGDTMIETIWKTYRGTGSMSERIEFFISQAPGFRSGNSGLPSADRAIVAQHKQNVQRGHRSNDPETVETAERSEAWLRERGIETVRRESDGYPTFPGPGQATDGSE